MKYLQEIIKKNKIWIIIYIILGIGLSSGELQCQLFSKAD